MEILDGDFEALILNIKDVSVSGDILSFHLPSMYIQIRNPNEHALSSGALRILMHDKDLVKMFSIFYYSHAVRH